MVLNARSISVGVKAVTRSADANAEAQRSRQDGQVAKATEADQAAQRSGGEASPSSVKVTEQGALPPAPAPQPRSAEERYFAAAKAATDKAKETDLMKRASATVGPATAATYAEVYERRMRKAPATGITAADLLKGVSRASWHSTRAAIMHHLAKDAAAVKAEQEVAFKAGDLSAAMARAKERLAIATVAADLMASEAPKERRKRLTKRETVPAAPDWQVRVYEAATEAQKPGVALLWASGCRPAEVEEGVDVIAFEKDGKKYISIDVPGAKVTEHSGQPRRRIIIDAESGPGSALLSVMRGADNMMIKRRADVLNNDFARIRKRLKDTGGADWAVSPYSMRHQMSAEAKVHFSKTMPDEKKAADKVATLLGHRVNRSQGRYGHPSQAKGGTGLVAVRATHPVKDTRSEPPSKTRSAPQKTIKPTAPDR